MTTKTRIDNPKKMHEKTGTGKSKIITTAVVAAAAVCAAIVILTLTFGGTAIAGEHIETDTGTLSWSLNKNGVLTISGSGDMSGLYTGGCGMPWGGESCYKIRKIVIKEGITTICDNAFESCDLITTVIIPDSVTVIGDSAFRDCCRLAKIDIPDSVTAIGDRAFWNCDALTDITIPDGVETLGSYVFDGCDALTEVSISAAVADIGTAAFEAQSLENILVDEHNPKYTDIDGVLYNKTVTVLVCCPAGKTEVLIPDTVTVIDTRAFDSCSGMTAITIPDSVTEIGDEAFFWCSSLKSITLPAGVTAIGNSVFGFCYDLTDIYYGGSEEDWNNIHIGSDNGILTDLKNIHFDYKDN